MTGKIAEVRGLVEGEAAVSPARFPDWTDPVHFKDFAARVREETGGIPIGVKLSAQHIEKDIDTALEIGVDYIILDGRGVGTWYSLPKATTLPAKISTSVFLPASTS